MKHPAQSDHPIHELISNRFSPRAFDSSRPVSKKELLSLLEAARWAASSYNEQPWSYLVFDGSDEKAREKANSCLVDGNAWAMLAPILLLAVAKEVFTRNGKPNTHGQYDTGQSATSLTLQAQELGLSVHQMAGFYSDKAREMFSIPKGYTPMAMIAIGYMKRDDQLSEEEKKREYSPRQRKTISEFAFNGQWGRPFGT